MAEDKLGRFMKDKVYHHHSATDAEVLWQKIAAQQVPPTNKRKGMLYWIWGAGIGLVLLSIGFFTISPSSTSVTQPLQVVKMENPIAATASPTTPPASTEKIVSTPPKQASTLPSPKQNTGGSASPILSSATQKANTKAIRVATPRPLAKTMSKQATKEFSQSLASAASRTTSNSITRSTSAMPLTAPTVDKTIAPAKRLEKESPLFKSQLVALPTLRTNSLVTPYFAGISTSTWAAERSNYRGGSNFTYAVGLSFFYGNSLKTLEAKSEEGQALADLRNDSETKLEVLGAGLDFQLTHRSGLYARIGFELEQINERFDFAFEEQRTYIDDNQLLEIIFDANGVPTEVYGPGEVTEFLTYQKKVYNSYRMLDIPLLVGYTFQAGDFGLFLESGVAMNALFIPEGELYNAEQEVIKLADQKEEIFNANLGLSILGGIGLSYQLSDQMNIYLSPRLKYRINPITTTDYPLRQAYTNTAIQLGMRYQWGN